MTQYLTMALGIALGLALLTDVGLGYLYNGALKGKAQAEASFNQAKRDAQECSAGVDALQAANAKKKKELEDALKLAQDAARKAHADAMKTLGLQPINPQDLCASFVSLSKQKIEARK